MAPKVLISDKLSDAAVQIFKDRGIDVDFQPDLGKDKDKLAAVIGDYDGLAIRSATKVTEKILADNGMNINDIDLFEVNEAFAAVVMRFMQAFDVDESKVNVNGGSIAMGHPLGATGAMIIGTLLDELERSDKEVGMATLCIASGMGAATIIERV